MTEPDRHTDENDRTLRAATALFERFPDPVAELATDDERTVRRVNDAFDTAFGPWDPGGDDPATLPPALTDRVPLTAPETLVTVPDGRVGHEGDGGNGDAADYHYRVRRVDAEACEYLVFTDVTEERGQLNRLEALHEATRELMSADDAEAVAKIAAQTTENVLGFPLNSVRFYESDPDRLVPGAVSDAVAELSPEGRPTYERGETIQWQALDSNGVLVFQDVRDIDDDVDRTGDGSIVMVGLGGRGVLTMGTQEHGAVSPTDEQLARVFGANVEVALELVERTGQLREQKAQLTRQNGRLNRFASVLSHDLRNPLNVASGTVELAAESVADGDATDRLDTAIAALERMDCLIEQTLTLAREGKTVEEPEPVALGTVAREAWRTVDAPEATFTLTAAADDRTLAGDPERLRTVFENCFRNAVEHGGPDITVTVGTLAEAAGFYVADDGPGISEDVGDEVFEFGVSGADDGTGFGLAIVAEIVDAHGWDVTAAGDEDDGARFEIRTG
ncbi:MAG: sensor histidine kinase [Halolamina sp.]